MAEFTIEEVAIPTSLATDSDGIFEGMAAVRNACEIAGYGIPEVAVTAAEMVPHYLDEHEDHRILLARVDRRIVGRGVHQTRRDEVATAWLDLQVLPEFQGRGIGLALAERLESVARAESRTRLISYAVSSDGPGERLLPRSGIGSVTAANREVRFARNRGWTLELVERGSRLALPLDAAAVTAARALAEPHAAGYRMIAWEGATPPGLLADMAVLQTRMSTDAPSADEPEDLWTAERVAEKEALLLDSPTRLLTAGAVHERDGRLAGFTRMSVPYSLDRPVAQWDTIVLREHRGHRLGMLLKLANLEQLEKRAPGHPSVLTWNAEQNRPMLDVNEAVGFVPIGFEGVWVTTLS